MGAPLGSDGRAPYSRFIVYEYSVETSAVNPNKEKELGGILIKESICENAHHGMNLKRLYLGGFASVQQTTHLNQRYQARLSHSTKIKPKMR